MKKSLPCFSVSTIALLAVTTMAQPAAPDAAAATESAPNPYAAAENDAAVAPGDRLLLQAAGRLEQRASISARLRHQLSLDGKQLYGVGSYWQQGSGEELKVRLELQLAGQESRLLQVSNSRFLWVDRRLPTGRSVSRIDLRQLRADPVLSAANVDGVSSGAANWSPLEAGLIAHSGGLPSLLASLAENFAFLPPQAMRLAVTPSAGAQASSLPVFAVVGHWRRDRLAKLVRSDPADGLNVDLESATLSELVRALPTRFPQEVLLLVGQADLFPCRLEYRRLQTPEKVADANATIPYQLSTNPMIVLEFSDVVYDAPLPAGQFDYMPGDADWTDRTAVVLERLRRERQGEIAKRNEAGVVLPTR
jgi:hypothetical protein